MKVWPLVRDCEILNNWHMRIQQMFRSHSWTEIILNFFEFSIPCYLEDSEFDDCHFLLPGIFYILRNILFIMDQSWTNKKCNTVSWTTCWNHQSFKPLSSSMVLCRYPVYLYTFGNNLDLRTWKIKIEYVALIHSKEWRMDPFCIKFRRILSKILKSTLYIFGAF